jgi:hypothetical protein
MKRTTIQIFYMLLLVTGSGVLSGQQGQLLQSEERVVMFCDRTLYITGEQIFFSAFLQTGDEASQIGSSRVLYCEIITPDGSKITGNKYLIENYSSFGYLTVPNDITTGDYYLRAYTKFMRNDGPYNYYYSRIKIVNPNRNEVQAGTNNLYIPESFSGELNTEKTGKSFLISTNKSQYLSSDTVHISIDGTGIVESLGKGVCLTVVPEFSTSSNNIKFPENRQFKNDTYYYSETRGLSITGKLRDNNTGNPLPLMRINLSIIGRGRDFMATQTDSTGRFFFSLPDYTGSRDLFLCTENTRTADPKILVDNDFCTVPVNIPSAIFTLSRQEREAAYNMAVNVQLESYFTKDTVISTGENNDENQVFYGKPSDILYLDDYIQLPTVEEYFNELPTLVKVRKRQDEKYFKVLGTQTELSDFEPLVMVDLVAIDDPAKVLAISPANISRIEVVNNLYVKGEQTYGGIINFISKKGDFAGIDLPSSGIFINYAFFAEKNHDQTFKLPQHTPDTRNTLYWQPQLLLNKNQSAKLSFTTSDTPGRYLIILNGINLQGEEFRQTAIFDVVK